MLHQIGSGVLGPVFRTYEPQRDRLIAVKAFRLDIVPEQVARLAEALRRLGASDPKHPAIVVAVDAGLEGSTAYLAMEYVAAETLDVALRHLAPSPLDRALPILSQIAEAIEAAWAASLGHGALHPRDVFITTATNDVRVTGFGVVPALESVGIRPPVRRPYAAPERATAEAWDIRADVYSLGAIAHELLTRRRPAGPSEQDGALVTGTTPEQRVQIRRVLSAALAERPEHRFATPGALIAALGAIVRGEPLGPLPEGGDDPAAHVPSVPVEVVGPAEPDVEPVGTAAIAVATVAVQIPTAPPVFKASPALETPAASITVQPPLVPSTESTSGSGAHVQPPDVPSPAPMTVAWVSPAPAVPHVPTAPFYVPVAPPASFPWVAVIAATVAGIFLGSVGGYRFGLARRPVAIAPAPVVTTVPVPVVPPSDTEVAVPPETVPPPAAAAQASPEAEASKGAVGKTAPASAAVTPAARGGVGLPGRLLVRSIPSGAAIAIDGHAHGQTPATVRDLAFGAHTLVVSHPGYASHSEKVTLTAEQPARNLTVELKPARVGRDRGMARSPHH